MNEDRQRAIEEAFKAAKDEGKMGLHHSECGACRCFVAGYDAGQRDAIAEFRRRVEEKMRQAMHTGRDEFGYDYIEAMAEVEKEMEAERK